jgi:hypothetical protein
MVNHIIPRGRHVHRCPEYVLLVLLPPQDENTIQRVSGLPR